MIGLDMHREVPALRFDQPLTDAGSPLEGGFTPADEAWLADPSQPYGAPETEVTTALTSENPFGIPEAKHSFEGINDLLSPLGGVSLGIERPETEHDTLDPEVAKNWADQAREQLAANLQETLRAATEIALKAAAEKKEQARTTVKAIGRIAHIDAMRFFLFSDKKTDSTN